MMHNDTTQIQRLLSQLAHPKPYDKGTDVLWTDSYISEQLLRCHLDEHCDLASRRAEARDAVIHLLQRYVCFGGSILDLGCGPGLYTQRLAELGYQVTGVDFSERSIAWAKDKARERGLSIDYQCSNYLSFASESNFDLVMMIYCDFGALVEKERDLLIERLRMLVKPGGLFVFDALTPKSIESMQFSTSWDLSEGGFYSPKPYICLNQSLHFPQQKALLNQHYVIREEGSEHLYRFWNHYYELEDVEQLFLDRGFSSVQMRSGLLSGVQPYTDEHVAFFMVER